MAPYTLQAYFQQLNCITNIAHSFFYILSILGALVTHLVKSYEFHVKYVTSVVYDTRDEK